MLTFIKNGWCLNQMVTGQMNLNIILTVIKVLDLTIMNEAKNLLHLRKKKCTAHIEKTKKITK